MTLSADDGSVHSVRSNGTNSHNEELPDLISQVLTLAKMTPEQLNSIVLGIGPGSFTGLRIGLSYVQGLAYALKLPVTAISSLAAYAQSVAEPNQVLLAISDARRSELFAANFSSDEHGWICPVGPEEIVPESAAKGAQSVLVGFVDGLSGVVRPSGVGEALLDLSERGFGQIIHDVAELSELTPNYLRAVAARTIAERSK